MIRGMIVGAIFVSPVDCEKIAVPRDNSCRVLLEFVVDILRNHNNKLEPLADIRGRTLNDRGLAARQIVLY
jgi:hypothetical protein